MDFINRIGIWILYVVFPAGLFIFSVIKYYSEERKR